MNYPDLRIYVLSPYCLLRPTTNRIYDMRMSDALAGHGADVEILYPYTYMRDNIRRSEIPKMYGSRHRVRERMLLTPLRENSPSWWRIGWIMFAFTLAAFRIRFRPAGSRKQTLVYSRDPNLLLPLLLMMKVFGGRPAIRTVFLLAEMKDRKLYKWVAKNSDFLLAGVSATRDEVRRLVDVPEDRFMLALAPVPAYPDDCSKAEARRRIGYSDSAPLVVYTGKLGLSNREVRHILEAAGLEPAYRFLFTGGRPSTVDAIKAWCEERNIRNVILTGFLKNSTAIRDYQLAADVLVSYYTSEDHMVEFNYPQKINEYLSTGNPVVTPDFPATRDVINERNVIFVEPDDSKALLAGIRKAVENPEWAATIAAQAKRDVAPLSFDERTGAWLRFVMRKS
jgi:glycosyltransferase involved in cell wall biosynthesis